MKEEIKIYFVRHAEPDFSITTDETRPLTAKGLADRAKVTEALIGRNIKRAYSSPYRRAFDTIKPLCDRLGLEIELDAGFRERAVSREWITLDDFNAFAKRQWEDPTYKLEGGDSLLDVQERNIRALNRVLSLGAGALGGGDAVIGSHGMALSAILNYYNKNFDYKDYEYIRPKMPYIICLYFENGIFIRTEEIKIREANG